uniref:Reverse transcriptase zinc-binding domain-containing protein n=1 Tax=Oryza nivara TaxID=4536 RepID=A0A0E0HJ02_ORYNI
MGWLLGRDHNAAHLPNSRSGGFPSSTRHFVEHTAGGRWREAWASGWEGRRHRRARRGARGWGTPATAHSLPRPDHRALGFGEWEEASRWIGAMRNRSAVVRSGGGHGRRRPPWHWHPRALACRISRFRPRNTGGRDFAHIFQGCSYTQEVWSSIRGWLGLRCSTPMESLPSWWCDARKAIKKRDRRAFDAGIILVTWLIWKQRNARVFEGHAVLSVNLCAAIEDEWKSVA